MPRSPRKRAHNAVEAKSTGEERVTIGGDSAIVRSDDITQLWREGSLCDAVVNVEGRTFSAHRLVLCARSPYMKGLFLSGMAESASSAVELEDLQASVFEALLTWMYTGESKLETALLPELLQAAGRLQIVALEAAVEALVIERIDASNCVSAWLLGDSLMRPSLVAAAEVVTRASFVEAAATDGFLRLGADALERLLGGDELAVDREEDVFRALKRWHEMQRPPPDCTTQGRLLGCVRWPQRMERAFVEEHVNPDSMVEHRKHVAIVMAAFQAAAYGALPRFRFHQERCPVILEPFDKQTTTALACGTQSIFFAEIHANKCVKATVRVDFGTRGDDDQYIGILRASDKSDAYKIWREKGWRIRDENRPWADDNKVGACWPRIRSESVTMHFERSGGETMVQFWLGDTTDGEAKTTITGLPCDEDLLMGLGMYKNYATVKIF